MVHYTNEQVAAYKASSGPKHYSFKAIASRPGMHKLVVTKLGAKKNRKDRNHPDDIKIAGKGDAAQKNAEKKACAEAAGHTWDRDDDECRVHKKSGGSSSSASIPSDILTTRAQCKGKIVDGVKYTWDIKKKECRPYSRGGGKKATGGSIADRRSACKLAHPGFVFAKNAASGEYECRASGRAVKGAVPAGAGTIAAQKKACTDRSTPSKKLTFDLKTKECREHKRGGAGKQSVAGGTVASMKDGCSKTAGKNGLMMVWRDGGCYERRRGAKGTGAKAAKGPKAAKVRSPRQLCHDADNIWRDGVCHDRQRKRSKRAAERKAAGITGKNFTGPHAMAKYNCHIKGGIWSTKLVGGPGCKHTDASKARFAKANAAKAKGPTVASKKDACNAKTGKNGLRMVWREGACHERRRGAKGANAGPGDGTVAAQKALCRGSKGANGLIRVWKTNPRGCYDRVRGAKGTNGAGVGTIAAQQAACKELSTPEKRMTFDLKTKECRAHAARGKKAPTGNSIKEKRAACKAQYPGKDYVYVKVDGGGYECRPSNRKAAGSTKYSGMSKAECTEAGKTWVVNHGCSGNKAALKLDGTDANGYVKFLPAAQLKAIMKEYPGMSKSEAHKRRNERIFAKDAKGMVSKVKFHHQVGGKWVRGSTRKVKAVAAGKSGKRAPTDYHKFVKKHTVALMKSSPTLTFGERGRKIGEMWRIAKAAKAAQA